MVFTLFDLIEDISDSSDQLSKMDIEDIKKIFKKFQVIKDSQYPTMLIDVNSDSIPSDEIEKSEYIELDDLDVDVTLSRPLKKKIRESFGKMTDELYGIIDINIVRQRNVYKPYRYDIEDDFNYINNLKSNNKIITSYYSMKLVMYFFIIENTLDKENNIVQCKIGFSDNVAQRKGQLEKHYGVNLSLVNIKEIAIPMYERIFHNKLKAIYPHMVVKKLNDKVTKEMYNFHPILIEEFNQFEAGNERFYEYHTEKEKTKQVELIEMTKQLDITEKTKQVDITEKTKQVEITEKEKTKQMEIISQMLTKGLAIDKIEAFMKLNK